MFYSSLCLYIGSILRIKVRHNPEENLWHARLTYFIKKIEKNSKKKYAKIDKNSVYHVLMSF